MFTFSQVLSKLHEIAYKNLCQLSCLMYVFLGPWTFF